MAENKPLDTSVLTSLPFDPSLFWFVPFVGTIFAFEVWHLGWRQSPVHQLLFSRSPSHRSDVFYFACDMFSLTPMLVVLMTLGASVAFDAWLGEPRTWRPAEGLPLWQAFILFLLVENFFQYAVHRFMHTKLMWPLHAVHHAASEMTSLSTLRHHPLDGFVAGFPAAVLAALLAFPLEAVFAVEIAVGAATTILHTRLPVPAWWERYVVAGPRVHGIHHSIDAADHDSNFALLPIYDWIFGTFRWHDRSLEFGVADARFDTGRPVRDIGAVTIIWLSGLYEAASTALGKSTQQVPPPSVSA